MSFDTKAFRALASAPVLIQVAPGVDAPSTGWVEQVADNAIAAADEIDRLRAMKAELVRLFDDVLPYAKAFWRSGEQPSACIAEAVALLAIARLDGSGR